MAGHKQRRPSIPNSVVLVSGAWFLGWAQDEGSVADPTIVRQQYNSGGNYRYDHGLVGSRYPVARLKPSRGSASPLSSAAFTFILAY